VPPRKSPNTLYGLTTEDVRNSRKVRDHSKGRSLSLLGYAQYISSRLTV